MSAVVTRHKFTADEYFRLYETGIFAEEDRIELIDGDLNIMQAQGSRHIQALDNLTADFGDAARGRYMHSVQQAMELRTLSVPEPDLMLVPYNRNRGGRSKAADVILIIEVSDSSLNYDREVKLPLYAGAGIPEFWIVNLVDDVVEVHREPEGDTYRNKVVVGLNGTVAPAAFPDLALRVSAIIPKR